MKLSPNFEKDFTHIIWASDFWGWCSAEQQALVEAFVRDLESSLHLKHTKASFREEWERSRPKIAGDISLDDYMRAVSSLPAFQLWSYSDKSTARR